MAKLNQIVAVEKGAKRAFETAATEAYHIAQQTALFQGMTRTYEPRAEDGERLPGEQKLVQQTVDSVLKNFIEAQSHLADVNATKVWANTKARADIIVDGKVLVAGAPVEFLLFLERKLTDLLTFLKALPTLDPNFKWQADKATGFWATEPIQSIRYKKIPRALIMVAATDKHPAQVQGYTEDVPEGEWTVRNFSGAVPATQIMAWTEKALKLSDAVKFARETANSIEAENQKVGDSIFDWLTK
jgi:hypothetical protein